MAVKTAAQLKVFFETGKKPTQEQFGDLIDTLFATSGVFLEFTSVTTSIQSDSLIGVLWTQVFSVTGAGGEMKTGGVLTSSDFDNVTGTIALPDQGSGIVSVVIRPAP